MRSSLWRILGGVLIALVAPIVVGIILAVLVLWVPPIGRYALSQALVQGGPRIGASVRFGRVEGNVMRSITLHDLVIKLGPDSLHVKEFSLTYDPIASVVRRTFSASQASAVRPRVFICSKRPDSGRRGARRIRFPSVRIDQFRLEGGSVYVDTAEFADSVDLALSLVSGPSQLEARLEDVRARLWRERVSLKSLGSSVRFTPDSLVVTDIVAETDASYLRAALRMAFGSRTVTARVDSLSVSLPEFTRLQGLVRLSGSLGLSQKDPSADVKYAARGLALCGVVLPTMSGRLSLADSAVQLTMVGADTALGRAEVTGRLGLRKLDFSSLVRVSGLRLRRLDSVLPDTRVDAELEVAGRRLDSIAASVTVRAPDLGIERLAATGRRVAPSQIIAVDQFELSGPVGVISGRGVWQKGRAEADVRLEDLDLALISRFHSLPMSGRVAGRVRMEGTVDSLGATADLSVFDLGVAGLRAKRVRADFAVTIGHVLAGDVRVAVDDGDYAGTTVDSVGLTWHGERFVLGVWRPGVRIGAEGSARLARDSIGVNVAALRVSTSKEELSFADALQFGVGRDSLDLRLAAAGLAGGDVRAALVRSTGRPAWIEATAGRVDLAVLKVLLGIRAEMSGTVSLSLAGSESLDMDIDAERLTIPDASLELRRVLGKVRVSRRRAAFDHLWLVHQDSSSIPETSSVTGWLEFGTRGGLTFGAADLRARLRNPGAWVVFYLKPLIELQRGAVYGDLTVRGSLVQPRLGGRVRISRARLGVPVIGAVFDRVNAELVFDRSRISIAKLSGNSDHGTALVTGFVDVGAKWHVDSLRFHGDFAGTTINPVPEVYGTIGGSLDLGWSAGRPFVLSGTVNVEEALVAFGFGERATAGAGPPDTMFTYDIRVRGDRNIWLRNDLVDIEWACDLAVRRTARDRLYSGDLTSRQGNIYYLDHTLRVDSGSVRFDNISTLDPVFDVTARMPIRAALADEGTPESVVVALTGTLEKPNLAFRSVPPVWEETDVLSYLTLNATQEQLSSPMDQKKAVSTLLSQRLLGYVQTQVSKRARGFVNLDYLEFESGLFDSSKQTRVTVGKYIGRNLYVSYTQGLSGDMIPSFRVEYYINRRNDILAEGNAAGAPGEPYRTSLRYRFRLRY